MPVTAIRALAKNGPPQIKKAAKEYLVVHDKKTNLTNQDWVLVFLSLNNNQKICGKPMFNKLLFTADKDFLSGQLDGVFRFQPHMNGPYTRKFDTTITSLLKKDYIEMNEKESTEGYVRVEYTLTAKGVVKANTALKQLDTAIVNQLKKLKATFIKKGYSNVLRQVYEKYPEYTVI